MHNYFNFLRISLILVFSFHVTIANKSQLDEFFAAGNQFVDDTQELTEIVKQSYDNEKHPNQIDTYSTNIQTFLLGWKMAIDIAIMVKEAETNMNGRLLALLSIDLLENVLKDSKYQENGNTQAQSMFREAVLTIQDLGQGGKYQAFESYAQKLNRTIDDIKDTAGIEKGSEIIHQALQEKPYEIDWRSAENKMAFLLMRVFAIFIRNFFLYVDSMVDSKDIRRAALENLIPITDLGRLLLQNNKNIRGTQELQNSVDQLKNATDGEIISKFKITLNVLDKFLANNYQAIWSS